MVYYLTTPNNLVLLKELCETKAMGFEYTTNIKDIKVFANNEVKKLAHVRFFVIDLDCLSNTDVEIRDSICGMKRLNDKARIIVVALGRRSDDNLICSLINNGISNIVLSKDKEIAKQEIEKCMSESGRQKEEIKAESSPAFAEEEKNIIPVKQPNTPKTIKKDMPIIGKSMVTIGVCGVEPHIGTTHHALAITSFLTGLNLKACYLEANVHGDMQKLMEIYEGSGSRICDDGGINWNGIMIYHDYSILDVINTGYQFYIYDYGTCREITSKEFISNDIKILVSGSKPWEFFNYNKVIENIASIPEFYTVMNYSEPKQQNALSWYGLEETTFFAEYSPSPFEGKENFEIYNKILNDYIGTRSANPDTSGFMKIKKRFFGGLKNK